MESTSLLVERNGSKLPESKLMKYILSLFFALLLVSCNNAAPQAVTPEAISTLVTSAITQTSTSIPPSPTLTSTPVPCDSTTSDFCIVDGNFIFQSPLNGSLVDLMSPTYRYGSTDNGNRDPHHGTDFNAANGDPVLAVADGTIVFAGSEKERIHSPWRDNFYGNFIVIRHANDIHTLYAHLSKILVETDQEVRVGETIGEVGRTGVAIGPHLHLEVRRGANGEDYFSTENPELWLILDDDENGNLYGALSITIDEGLTRKVPQKIVLEYYPVGAESPQKTIHAITYSDEFEHNQEDMVLSNMQPGRYRIAFSGESGFSERWVEIVSGKLTQVILIVK